MDVPAHSTEASLLWMSRRITPVEPSRRLWVSHRGDAKLSKVFVEPIVQQLIVRVLGLARVGIDIGIGLLRRCGL
jgi:hypothetical protein